MMYKIFSFLSLLLIFSGCSNSVEKVNKTVKLDQFPKHQVPKVVQPPKANAKGSLFSSRSQSLFSDRKNLQIGDIVFVIINEGTTGSGRKTETGGGLKQEQKENTRTINPVGIGDNKDTPGVLSKIINGINGLIGLSIDTGNGQSKFETESETTATDQLVNNISTVITQPFQNGNYFIEGEKNIVIKGQKVTVELSGVMNPQDLNTNSEVNSNRLANLKVKLYKNGTEAELDEKPWGTKLIDTITPF